MTGDTGKLKLVKIKETFDPKTLKSGTPLHSWIADVNIDGELHEELAVKCFGDRTAEAFTNSEEVNVEKRSTEQWGDEYVLKAPKTGGGSSGGFSRGKTPEESRRIVRQNALTNAVNYVNGLSPEDRVEHGTKEYVVELMEYFSNAVWNI